MALIDEMKLRRNKLEETLDEIAEAIEEQKDLRLRVERELDDFDRAIAALEPPPAAVTEPEREPEPQDDASEFSEEGYAPVVEAEPLADPIWNEPEPTKPEADFSAKALDHYDPKAVAERERFNPFAMFRKEGDQ